MQEEGAADDHNQRQAQKMQTVGRMVGGVAHDFANLITLIASYSEILLNRLSENDPSRVELKEIRKAAARGAHLTSQLLGFARSQTLESKVIDLSGLVRDVQEMLRPIIGENIQIQLALAPNVGRVQADPGQIELVAMNLILNARDAMPKGGSIRLETSDMELDEKIASQHGVSTGAYVMLSITDTGHGIDPASMKNLFEPFFTTKEKGKGTGLGLSTVREIVSGNGGAVWATSIPGAGATFTACLPRMPGTPNTADNSTDAGASLRPVAPGAETVLLVEDEEPVRRLLTYILRSRGYQVFDAGSGADALAIFAEHGDRIDLLLTDMVMPQMTGRELSEHLRELRPDLKVVFMSGYTDEVLVRTGAISPGMSFLQKPLRPDKLAATVRAALDSPPLPFNPR